MENYQGDLADIIRAGYVPVSGTLASTTAAATSTTVNSWQLQANPTNFQEEFGLPFSNDPLLNELDMSFFTTTSSSNNLENDTGEYYGNFVGAHNVIGHNNIGQEENIIKRPCNNNFFSKTLQISPNKAKLPIPPLGSPTIMAANSSRRLIKVPPPSLNLPNEHLISGNGSKVASCLMENTGLQISSPRNSGVKRRAVKPALNTSDKQKIVIIGKSQAKKVVCIPAPAPAPTNSRPTGEIVPSDLWAWRKYGQKPIKGSPYPRGYYRCSSSKGCSARKQVERSRTDPNMLVITYTSEHNHPWPTQRNALAGSTRSSSSSSTTQFNKHINPNTTNSKNSPTTSLKAPESTPFKQEKIETNSNDKDVVLQTETTNSRTVKEEEMEEDKELMEMDDGDQLSGEIVKNYKPSLPVCNLDQDFFAELGEIECDPLDTLFTQGFCGDHEDKELISNKGLGSFNFYDWSVGNGNGNGNYNTSFGDASKKGL